MVKWLCLRRCKCLWPDHLLPASAAKIRVRPVHVTAIIALAHTSVILRFYNEIRSPELIAL